MSREEEGTNVTGEKSLYRVFYKGEKFQAIVRVSFATLGLGKLPIIIIISEKFILRSYESSENDVSMRFDHNIWFCDPSLDICDRVLAW